MLTGFRAGLRLSAILLLWPVSNTCFGPPASAQTKVENDAECQKILKAHGFLSRAQFQCGFREYSNEMIESARRCAQRLNKTVSKDLLSSGMATFDENEREKGHKLLCEEILSQFPGIVRN